MQQSQQNYKKLRAALQIGLVALTIEGSSAHAAIAVRAAPEPLLHDGVKGPCDPQLQSPDLVPGADVNGNAVAPADLARVKNPAPAEILVPLRNGGSAAAQPGEPPVAALDGKALDPILNPVPACPPGRR